MVSFCFIVIIIIKGLLRFRLYQYFINSKTRSLITINTHTLFSQSTYGFQIFSRPSSAYVASRF